MKFIIEKDTKKHAYLQLYTQIKNDIVTGRYKYGTKLPSKRLLSEETGVSIITVEHTYSLLAEEGYIEPRQRSGYFVVYKESDGFWGTKKTVVYKESEQPHIDVSEFFPFSVYAKTMRRVLSDYGENIFDRCENTGSMALRSALAAYLNRSRDIRVIPEQIVIGAGAEYLYSLIVQLLGRENTFAIEDPSYEKIEMVYRANGVECELLKLGNDGILSDALKASKAKVLHITPYRSFPSGVSASAAKRREYLRWVHANDGYIIEDDFESEFTVSRKSEETVFSLDEKERVIYLNTFSKTIAPSVRIGYMVLPQSLLELYKERVGFYSCTVPSFDQYVLAEFINNGDFERHINRIRRKKRRVLEDKR